MFLRELVEAPRPLPAPYGLVNSKTTVPGTGHWENGIAYEVTTDGLYAKVHDSCDYSVDDGVEIGDAPGSAASANHVYSGDYAPFLIEATDGCRTSVGFTPEERKTRAADALELLTPKAVERQFWANDFNGVGSEQNFSLQTASADVLFGTTGVSPRRGIAALEQALADAGAGTLGAIHITRDVLSLAKYDMGLAAIDPDNDDVLRAPGGNMLIGGVGYPGTGPAGEARSAGLAWAFATGPVAVRLSPIKVSDEPSKVTGLAGVESFHTNNTLVYTAERFAAVTVNGIKVFAVLIDLDG